MLIYKMPVYRLRICRILIYRRDVIKNRTFEPRQAEEFDFFRNLGINNNNNNTCAGMQINRNSS